MFGAAFASFALSSALWCGAWSLETVDVVDEEVPATMLLQNEVYRLSRPQDPLPPTALRSKLLIVIVSCHAHTDTWPSLVEWGNKVHPGGKVLVLAGRLPNGTLPWPNEHKVFHHDSSLQHLIVNASDSYDGLPERMLVSFHSILRTPELADITHVLKLDDTTILGTYGPSKPDGMDATKVELALSKQPADYLCAELGYRAYDCAALGTDKLPSFTMQWHYTGHAMVNDSHWYHRDQPCNGQIAYADGEFGYILSRKALNVLVEAWPLESMDDVYHRYVYEDLMVGETLQNHSVTLRPIHLQGMQHWERHKCPCNIASSSAACDAVCASPLSDRRCCFSACVDNPGLCHSAIDA
jgi:hypothetical protein